jgi:hypothetical protein
MFSFYFDILHFPQDIARPNNNRIILSKHLVIMHKIDVYRSLLLNRLHKIWNEIKN